MKKAPRLTPLILLPIFAIAGSTWGVQFAHADTVISMFTGTFSVDGDHEVASMDRQSFPSPDLLVLFGSNFPEILSTDLSIANYFDDHGCDNNVFPCSENWSGIFNGGSVSVGGGLSTLFGGTVTGGSFSGG